MQLIIDDNILFISTLEILYHLKYHGAFYCQMCHFPMMTLILPKYFLMIVGKTQTFLEAIFHCE